RRNVDPQVVGQHATAFLGIHHPLRNAVVVLTPVDTALRLKFTKAVLGIQPCPLDLGACRSGDGVLVSSALVSLCCSNGDWAPAIFRVLGSGVVIGRVQVVVRERKTFRRTRIATFINKNELPLYSKALAVIRRF